AGAGAAHHLVRPGRRGGRLNGVPTSGRRGGRLNGVPTSGRHRGQLTGVPLEPNGHAVSPVAAWRRRNPSTFRPPASSAPPALRRVVAQVGVDGGEPVVDLVWQRV